MLFNSLTFFLFFGVVSLGYYALPHRYRWVLLLFSSCYFYLYFIPIYILILFFTIGVDYVAGIYIETSAGTKRKKTFLILSLIANFGTLFFFKYYNFLNENITSIFRWTHHDNPLPYLNILLPIGLSFHTFQAVSYTIEVYRGNAKAERHFGIYALYVMFYPQLVAGPIERPQHMLHQFREKHIFSSKQVIGGLQLMLWGLFKKVAVGDLLSVYVNSIYDNYQMNTGFTLCVATWAFALMIYCDFSGYSDIAVGVAQVMGFELMTNFRFPYFSKSITEFWRRWHISLSSWLRDYLYIPLGGSRSGKFLSYRNLMITMLLGGLWHGASWNFVIWGALNGMYLVVEKITGAGGSMTPAGSQPFFSRAAKAFFTFNLVCLAWIFFRSQTFSQAWYILCNIFHSSGFFTLRIQDTGLFCSMLLLVTFLLSIEYFFLRKAIFFNPVNGSIVSFKTIGFSSLLILLIILFGNSEGGQFIYFQF